MNRPSSGRSYYRTPLLKALPNQSFGYLFQGDYAYSYRVALDGAPSGSRIVNKNGQEQDLFTTAPGKELEFYVEIPADKVVGNTGEISVNVSTEQFRRAAPLLWKPTVETAYEALLENYFIADNATKSLTVNYSGIGGMAQVIVNKTGEQVSGHEKITTEFGTVFKPVYSKLPLAGSTYEIYILSASGEEVFEGTDGEFYIDGDKLFAGVLTSSAGQTSFDVLPMDVDYDQTGYRVIEKSTTPGYLGLTGAVQELYLNKNNEGLVSGTVSYDSQRVKVSFGFNKFEEYFNDEGERDFRPVSGITFGVYSVNQMGDIPAGSLIGIITSDSTGYVDGTSLDLPVNQKFTIKEIKTKASLQLDTKTYHLNTSVQSGNDALAVSIDVMDGEGVVVDYVNNYLRPADIQVSREVEFFDKSKNSFSFSEIVVAKGQIGIYSDAEATVLVKTLGPDDFQDGLYKSGGLADGRYYVKDLGYAHQYATEEKTHAVDVKAGETVSLSIRNSLLENNASLKLTDVTNPQNPRPMKDVAFNLVLDGSIIKTVKTDASGVAVFEFKVGQTYEIVQSVPAGYNIPTENPIVDSKDDDGTHVYPMIEIGNVKNSISVSLRVTVKDEATGLAVQGIEYDLYAKDDTNFTTPLFETTTDRHGIGLFFDIPASTYLLKEVKTHGKYAVGEVVQVDLSTVGDGDTMDIEISLKLVSVSIKLNNIDEETQQKINGARFGLYQASNQKTPISEFVVTREGTYNILNIPSGEYVLKQTAAPAGYVISSAVKPFTVNTNTDDVTEITFSNKPVTAQVIIVAVDSKTNKRLPDASFDLYSETDADLENKLDALTTNSNGQINIENARIGVYKLIEITPPVGYTRQAKDVRIDLSAVENGDIVTITVRYTRDGSKDEPTIIVERPNTGVFDNTVLFIILSTLMILLGIGVGALSFLKLSDE